MTTAVGFFNTKINLITNNLYLVLLRKPVGLLGTGTLNLKELLRKERKLENHEVNLDLLCDGVKVGNLVVRVGGVAQKPPPPRPPAISTNTSASAPAEAPLPPG